MMSLHLDIRIGSRWKHHSGKEYTVIHIANQFTENPKYPVLVVYLGGNGKVWAKELQNFVEKMKLIK